MEPNDWLYFFGELSAFQEYVTLLIRLISVILLTLCVLLMIGIGLHNLIKYKEVVDPQCALLKRLLVFTVVFAGLNSQRVQIFYLALILLLPLYVLILVVINAYKKSKGRDEIRFLSLPTAIICIIVAAMVFTPAISATIWFRTYFTLISDERIDASPEKGYLDKDAVWKDYEDHYLPWFYLWLPEEFELKRAPDEFNKSLTLENKDGATIFIMDATLSDEERFMDMQQFSFDTTDFYEVWKVYDTKIEDIKFLQSREEKEEVIKRLLYKQSSYQGFNRYIDEENVQAFILEDSSLYFPSAGIVTMDLYYQDELFYFMIQPGALELQEVYDMIMVSFNN